VTSSSSAALEMVSNGNSTQRSPVGLRLSSKISGPVLPAAFTRCGCSQALRAPGLAKTPTALTLATGRVSLHRLFA
jgi:hypothetical protein